MVALYHVNIVDYCKEGHVVSYRAELVDWKGQAQRTAVHRGLWGAIALYEFCTK